jgi:hypothetical protein
LSIYTSFLRCLHFYKGLEMRYISILLLLSVQVHAMDNPQLSIAQTNITNQNQIFRHRDITSEYVFNYPLDKIMDEFKVLYNVNGRQANKMETDLKTFLLNSALSDRPQRMFYHQTANLWHFFILHTREYHLFCFKCFGKFIHHQPHDRDEFILKDSCGLTSLYFLSESGC